MQLVADGNPLIIDIEEWINKSSGFGSISLGIDNGYAQEPTRLAEWCVLLGSQSYAELIPRLFASADVEVHQETYDKSDYDSYGDECVRIDSEGDRIVLQDYADWAASRDLTSCAPTETRPEKSTNGGSS